MLDILKKAPIIPVLSVSDLKIAVPLARALFKGGMHVIEIALRTVQALDAIKLIRSECPEIVLGAGTILTKEQMHAAILAGAQLGVSPVSEQSLLQKAKDNNFLFLPGVSTPTEIATVVNFGFTTLKLFPIDLLGGERFIEGIVSSIFPKVNFCCSSGISDPTDIKYLKYQNVISVASGWSAPVDLVVTQQWDAITKKAETDLLMANRI